MVESDVADRRRVRVRGSVSSSNERLVHGCRHVSVSGSKDQNVYEESALERTESCPGKTKRLTRKLPMLGR